MNQHRYNLTKHKERKKHYDVNNTYFRDFQLLNNTKCMFFIIQIILNGHLHYIILYIQNTTPTVLVPVLLYSFIEPNKIKSVILVEKNSRLGSYKTYFLSILFVYGIRIRNC